MNRTLTMSKKERERLVVLTQLHEERLSHDEAARMLNISTRHLWRLRRRFSDGSEAALIHRLRGKKSNRGYDEQTQQRVLQLYRERYSDYGPTLFGEALAEEHDLSIGTETLRQWLKREGLWNAQRKRARHRRKRTPRAAIGEMVQFDGSPHDWFEGRAPACCLLTVIDDASGRVFLRFAESESTEAVMQTLIEYIRRYGIPQSFYSDGGSVYYASSGSPTDVALALGELNVRMIRAHSPQAKGRVERGNRTQQDRLIKKMRQAGISSIAEANVFLDNGYLDEHNARFAHGEGLTDVHRSAEGIVLEDIFVFRQQRSLNNDFTVRLNNRYLQLLEQQEKMPRPGARIAVHQRLDGSLSLCYEQQPLRFTLLEQKPTQPARRTVIPKADHPWHKRRLGRKKTASSRERIRQRLQQQSTSSTITMD